MRETQHLNKNSTLDLFLSARLLAFSCFLSFSLIFKHMSNFLFSFRAIKRTNLLCNNILRGYFYRSFNYRILGQCITFSMFRENALMNWRQINLYSWIHKLFINYYLTITYKLLTDDYSVVDRCLFRSPSPFLCSSLAVLLHDTHTILIRGDTLIAHTLLENDDRPRSCTSDNNQAHLVTSRRKKNNRTHSALTHINKYIN